MELRIAYYCVETGVLGPGRRFILYLQGCPFRCPGCCSPEWRDPRGGILLKISEIISLMKNEEPLNGLTVSGGEPLYQAVPLKALLSRVRKEFLSWDIIVFTGYRYENLDENLKSVLELADLAVCGPFVVEEFTSYGLRGSKNQEFVYITNRLLEHRKEIEKGGRKNKTQLVEDGLLFVGIPILPDLYFSGDEG